MQIKIMRYHFTFIRLARIKRQIVDVGKDVEKLEAPYNADGNIK